MSKEIPPWEYDPTYAALRPSSSQSDSKPNNEPTTIGLKPQSDADSGLLASGESLRSFDRNLPKPGDEPSTSVLLPESLERTG